MSKPAVVIVGRSNIGKSSLFNAIVGEPISIVKDIPGATRGRIYVDYTWLNRDFMLIDTDGIEPEFRDKLLVSMREQTEIAIETADIIIFPTDARIGVTDADDRVADILRYAKKPTVFAVNKVDNFTKFQNGICEFYNLACGDLIPVSAASRLGVDSLLEAVEACFPQVEESEVEEDEHLRVVSTGKPNVGKSSIIDRLFGGNRVIVSDIAGTTRDAIDTAVVRDGQEYIFIDTAGIQRKSKIHEDIERYSIVRMVTAVERADVVLLVADASEGVIERDAKIAGVIHEKGKGILIITNEWDLAEKTDRTMKEFTGKIENAPLFMSYAEFLFVSVETGQRMNKSFEMTDTMRSLQTLRIRMDVLNEIITEATVLKQPSSDKGHCPKVFYASQVAVGPSTFVLFMDNKELMHFFHQRYPENRIREVFGFHGIILRFFIRERQGKDKE